MVSPMLYNIGDNIPLIDNLFLGPSLFWSFGDDVGILIGARVGL